MTTVITTTQIQLQSFPKDSSLWVPNRRAESDPEEIRQDTVPPINAVEVLQKWNYPPENVYRVGASFWGFFMMGMNDGSYGVSLLLFCNLHMDNILNL